jgi:hypothetical protein
MTLISEVAARMSMNGFLLSITPELVSRIAEDTRAAAEIATRVPDRLDLGSNWQAIHFLITGNEHGGEEPLADAIIGTGVDFDLNTSDEEAWFEAERNGDEPPDPHEHDFDVIVLEEGEISPYGGQIVMPNYAAEVSAALAQLDEATVRDRFNPSRMLELDLHPGDWTHNPDERLELLIELFGRVRALYAAAAENGHGVLFYLA